MSTVNIFEVASRNAFRFNSDRGALTVEDLWKLPLSGKTLSLDSVAKGINRQLKAEEEDSFVTPKKDTATQELSTKLEILKHIIAVRQEENSRRIQEVERAERVRKLTEVLESKREDALRNMDEAEILKELEALKG